MPAPLRGSQVRCWDSAARETSSSPRVEPALSSLSSLKSALAQGPVLPVTTLTRRCRGCLCGGGCPRLPTAMLARDCYPILPCKTSSGQGFALRGPVKKVVCVSVCPACFPVAPILQHLLGEHLVGSQGC